MVQRILTAVAGLPTTGSIDTPIGTLEISNGYPTEVTTKKLFDEMDFQRAVQAYLWALPMVGSAQWQNEQRDKFGAGDLDYIIDDSPLKQGLFSPGRFVPVIDSSVLNDPQRRPDYLVILAWNFADPIIRKQEAYRQAGGKFIVPIPELRTV